jgi:hypothetical protein
MNEKTYDSGRVDHDIFTTFKADHRQGMILWDKLVAHPSLDTQWWALPSLFTTEDFNIFQPDHLSLKFGWAQLIGSLELDAACRLAHFLETPDREDSYSQFLLYGGLQADITMVRRQTNLILNVEHDVNRGATGLTVALVCFGQGHAREALLPEERSFAGLRRLNSAAVWK